MIFNNKTNYTVPKYDNVYNKIRDKEMVLYAWSRLTRATGHLDALQKIG
jgi:hypothetical protein